MRFVQGEKMNQITVTSSVSPAPSECLRQLLWYQAAKERMQEKLKPIGVQAPRDELMRSMFALQEHMPITIIELRKLVNFPQGAMSSQISTLIKLGFLVRQGKRQSAGGLNRRVMAFSFTEKGLEYARTC